MPRTNLAVRRSCRLAAAVAALAIALPAQAQRTKKDAAATTPARAPAAVAPTPSRPAGAAVPAPPARGFFASRGPSSMGLGVGAFSSGKASGLAAHVDYGFVRTPPSWRRLSLEWRLRAMFARPTEETDLSRTVVVNATPVTIASGVEKTSVYVFEVGPMARVRLTIGPKLSLFADAGAGIAQTLEKYDSEEMYMGRTVEKKNVTALYVGGAVGVALDLTERLQAMLLPVAFSAHLGTDYSAFLPTLAVAYRL